MAAQHTSLGEHFSRILPDGLHLDLFHISTPPTLCPALFSPPPGQKPVPTFCEEHLLTATHSLPHDAPHAAGKRVAIFAIEVYVYTTSALTTIFVSKADSTGYAHLLTPPHGHRSVLKTLASGFVEFLVDSRYRSDRKLNVSLFARAQDQYLFPGSVEHGKKHVLSDRGLVKWWCSTLDPLLRRYPHPKQRSTASASSEQPTTQAYLIVPGHDKYETTSFYPPSARQDQADLKRWSNGHPLREITSYPNAAPRSVIPHFPDDPKSRFLLDLDEELTNAPPTGELQTQPSPSKRGTGRWTSVKTLDQFWDMMAFRQECSSGRLTGFLWILFSPPGARLAGVPQLKMPPSPTLRPVKRKHSETEAEPEKRQPKKPKHSESDAEPATTPSKRKKASKSKKRRKTKQSKKLVGPVRVRQPRVKTDASQQLAKKLPAEKASAWYWPAHARGSIILPEKAYERIIKILHRLDFANLGVASSSTEKWIRETAVIASAASDWSVTVVGSQKLLQSVAASGRLPAHAIAAKDAQQPATNGVNSLNTSLVRKKSKVESSAAGAQVSTQDSKPAVNSLGSGSVRKKPKA